MYCSRILFAQLESTVNKKSWPGQLARFFLNHLDGFLTPFLEQLDEVLDKRLVHTFAGLCSCIIRLRSRSTGLLLSELGAYLLSFDKAPAGTKRISDLLRSVKWEDKIIVDYLASQAQQYVEELLKKQQDVFLLWDESVQEKPESIESEGLCAVRSSKGKRLTRIKRGYRDGGLLRTTYKESYSCTGT